MSLLEELRGVGFTGIYFSDPLEYRGTKNMDLRDVHKEILPEIQEELLYIAAGYHMEEIGDVFERLCEYFQALGICHLLETVE